MSPPKQPPPSPTPRLSFSKEADAARANATRIGCAWCRSYTTVLAAHHLWCSLGVLGYSTALQIRVEVPLAAGFSRPNTYYLPLLSCLHQLTANVASSPEVRRFSMKIFSGPTVVCNPEYVRLGTFWWTASAGTTSERHILRDSAARSRGIPALSPDLHFATPGEFPFPFPWAESPKYVVGPRQGCVPVR